MSRSSNIVMSTFSSYSFRQQVIVAGPPLRAHLMLSAQVQGGPELPPAADSAARRPRMTSTAQVNRTVSVGIRSPVSQLSSRRHEGQQRQIVAPGSGRAEGGSPGKRIDRGIQVGKTLLYHRRREHLHHPESEGRPRAAVLHGCTAERPGRRSRSARTQFARGIPDALHQRSGRCKDGEATAEPVARQSPPSRTVRRPPGSPERRPRSWCG